MSLPTKEKEQVLRDAAVVECSELAGRNGQRDVAEHKAFVTTKISKIRLPYSRFPEQVRRRAVPIGTSNDDECLPRDPTGDRRSIIIMVARKKGWSKKDVEMNMPKIVGEWRDRLFGHAKWLLAQGESCSYRHWTESSLRIREELIEEAEKRSYHLEIAINDLISKVRYDGFGNSDGLLRLRDGDKMEGIPLQVPMDCQQSSIMRMIKHNTAKCSNVARNLSARMVADTLKKKGWVVERRRLKSGKGNPVAHWKPPAK